MVESSIFSESDRPAPLLPPELEGKTPVEVAQYYQNREREIVMGARTGAPNPPPPPITAEQFQADPLASTRELITRQSVSRDEFNRMSINAQANMVATAKLVAREGKEYWVRLLPEMDKIAKNSDPVDTIRPDWWETTYNYLVGQNLQTLRREDTERAAARASSEGVSNPGTPPPTPRDLTAREVQVAQGLGMTQDAWRLGEQRLEVGKLPVTLDNRNQRPPARPAAA